MKRKFYLLALVCAVAGTSVISSCKDTDEDLYNDLKNQLATTSQDYQKLYDEIQKLKSGILNGKDGADGKDGVNGKDGKNAVEVWLDENPGKTEADFWESLKGKDGKDGATIDDLLEAMKIYETKEEHAADSNKIWEAIKKLQEDLKKLNSVSGVVIQNVYNPAFGYVALPLGIQSNILTAYYSDVEESKYFPGVAPAVENGLTLAELQALGYIKDASDVTDAELKAMTYDLTEREIKLGKVYMTVNPTSLNLAGKVTPTLVTTSGKETGISFSALEACDEDLYFAYTRAANGFYVADAKVSDRGAVEEIHLNLEERAKEIKEALQGSTTNAGKIIQVTYELLNKVCKRKAIQVTYDGKTVTSEAALAAALVKPLNFEILQKVCDSDYMTKLKDITAPTTGKKPVDRVLTEAQKGLDNLYAASLPAIVVEDAEGAALMSVTSSSPSVVANELKLHAVSYCAETLVPYVYKHVAVVKVEGLSEAENAKAMTDANNTIHMNCTVNHNDYKDFVIDLAGLKKGATYTIVYSAMDFDGNVKAQRFYFTVK